MNTKLKLITSNAPSIICDGDTVIIESLTIQNQDLNDYMKDKVDPIEAVDVVSVNHACVAFCASSIGRPTTIPYT